MRPAAVRTPVERRREVGGTEEADRGGIVRARGQVSDLARRHYVSPKPLFQWSQVAKAGRLLLPLDDGVTAAPVVVDRKADR